MKESFVERHTITLFIWGFGYLFLFLFVFPFIQSISDLEMLIPVYSFWTGICLFQLSIVEWRMSKIK